MYLFLYYRAKANNSHAQEAFLILGDALWGIESTHRAITPELSHLSKSHGGEQCLPDFQLEHVPNHHLHGHANLLAVVQYRALIVAQLGAEVKDHLRGEEKEGEQKRCKRYTHIVCHSLEINQRDKVLVNPFFYLK